MNEQTYVIQAINVWGDVDHMATAKRMELGKEFFPNGVNADGIKLLDRVEAIVKDAIKDGMRLNEKIAFSEGPWSNNACFGYFIQTARNMGMKDSQIKKYISEMRSVMDMDLTVEAAKDVYNKSPF